MASISKAERKWRQRQRQKEREQNPPPGANESDFARYDWTGQAACDQFFKLHKEPAFGGTSDTGVVLPPHSLSVSRRPTAGISVIEAYSHGLSYAEQVFGAGGVMLFFLAFYLPAAFLFFWSEWRGLDLLDLAFLIFGLGTFWFMFRFDTSGYRNAPVMFNRALGKVHVFTDQTKFWGLLPLWGGGKFSIETYDWPCIRAQVSRFQVFTGNIAQENAALSCIVLKAPDVPEVVAEFSLGITSNALAVQLLLDHWEHIRRYMEHEGPMFVEGEGPYEQPTTQSLLGAIFFGQPFIGPGWREQYDNADWPTMIWQGISPFFFPVTMLLGVARWASYHIRSEPKWPAEILASVGGATLHGADLDAWRRVIPEKPQRIDAPTRPALDAVVKEGSA